MGSRSALVWAYVCILLGLAACTPGPAGAAHAPLPPSQIFEAVKPAVVLVEAATDRLPSGATAAASGELPFTGGETQGLLALAGGLLAAGAALASRRRRGESRV